MTNAKFRSGDGDTTKIGYANRNNQICQGTLNVDGTDFFQIVYRLECLNCGYVYGANGSDIAERKCPECQGGKPGIRYWKK
jgi:rubredoxin